MFPELSQKSEYRVGVISDTHGHLPKTAATRLSSADLIIHAGDIDTPKILADLKQIAPVVFVRGNMDRGVWASRLSPTEGIQVGHVWIYVIHDLSRFDLAPEATGFQVAISGHTHRPHLSKQRGTIYLNPGSTTHPRHPFPASMAFLEIREKAIDVRFIDLERNQPLDDLL
jgi:putative phosphoesterase